MDSHDGAGIVIFLLIFLVISMFGYNTNHRINVSNFEQAVKQCSTNDGIKYINIDLELLRADDFIVKCNSGAEFVQTIQYRSVIDDKQTKSDYN